MTKLVMGYPAADLELGVAEDALDVGRNLDGELMCSRPSGATNQSPPVLLPRLFNPSPVDVQTSAEGEPVPTADRDAWNSGGVRNLLRQLRSRLSRRQLLVGGVVSVVLIVVLLSSLIPPEKRPNQASSELNTPSTQSMSAASVPTSMTEQTSTEVNPSDPVAASIDLALAGAISSLGAMHGVPRSAVSATVSSRAGDIVLIDVKVTKSSGLTAFATVLLQKVGSQWRMRQVVDERN